jgi:ribose transport system substrate-binding protein
MPTSPLGAIRMAGATIAMLAAVTACGGSSSSSGGQASTDGTQVTAAAQKLVDAQMQRPDAISVSQAHTKAIPTGKKVVYISCGQPACIQLGEGLKSAAAALDWKATVLATDGSPEKIAAAWKQVANGDYDGVIGSGFPRSMFERSLLQLKAKNVPVIMVATTDPAENGISLVLDGPDQIAKIAKTMAAWAVAQTGGTKETLYVRVSALASQQAQSKAFLPAYKALCPSCKLNVLDMPLTAIGKDSSNRIVSYLRSHPNVNNVVICTGGITVGLPAALKAAGLAGKVKVFDQAPSQQGQQYVASGQQAGTVPFPTAETMWQAADALARIYTGESPEADKTALPIWVVTGKDIPSATEAFPVVESYQEQFRKLWGK